MKLDKLIKTLKTFNPQANVTTSIAEDICISYITGGGQNQDEFTKENTPQVFIDPCDCLCCANYDYCDEHDNGVCDKFILEVVA